MTRLFNEPAEFADEMVARVRRGERALRPRACRVAWCGRRCRPRARSRSSSAAARATTRPSADSSAPASRTARRWATSSHRPRPSRSRSVATAAQQGGGVLFTYGNYAGDVLNFDAAQDQLRAEGIPCETVTVTDDIFERLRSPRSTSAAASPATSRCSRSAGAAAEAGYDLEGVARVARLANERTRSFGVAFTGCTLPGAEEPLFTRARGPHGRRPRHPRRARHRRDRGPDRGRPRGAARRTPARGAARGRRRREGRPRRPDPQRPRRR